MQFSVLSKSELIHAGRIDAEHYSPRFHRTLKQLGKNRIVKLKQIISEPVKTGHTPSTKIEDYYNPDAIKFIKTDNLREDRIETHDVQMLSENGNSVISRSELHTDDVIITIIGATEEIIGRAARVPPRLGRANINQNIALIRSSIPSGYMSVFLNTTYGREQLIWLSRQTEQFNLNCREVEDILVPQFSNDFIKQINDLNTERNNLLYESVDIYNKAEEVFLSEVGLKDWKSQHTLTYVDEYRRTIDLKRIDAEYFNPSYDNLVERIQEYPHGCTGLLNIADDVRPNFNPKENPQKIYSYVELADIDASIGVIQGSSEITGEEAPSRARRQIRKGDVIVSSVEGSLEKTALVSEEYGGAIASTGFFQFRSRDVLPEVLFALSKSVVIQLQLKREAVGTILTSVPQESLKKVIVPKLPIPLQEKISGLVQESHLARKQAKELLERAKRAVEIAIEKGEDDATQFLQST